MIILTKILLIMNITSLIGILILFIRETLTAGESLKYEKLLWAFIITFGITYLILEILSQGGFININETFNY